NGSVTVCGTKSIKETKIVVNKLKRLISGLGYNLSVTSFKVNNISSSLTYENKINLNKFVEHILTVENYKNIYESTQFPAVRIYLKNNVTLLVYSSGKIIISGCKSESQVYETR